MGNLATHMLDSQAQGFFAATAELGKNVDFPETVKAPSLMIPRISLLKNQTTADTFNVPLVSNMLLLPLESCLIDLSGEDETPVALPIGRAMLVCGATASVCDARVTEGSCIAVEMSMQACNEINPLKKKSICWSEAHTFPMSQQLSALANLANRYVCNGIAGFSCVGSAIATMSFVEVFLSLSARPSTEQCSLTDQDLSDIQSYIDDNLERSICLKELARTCDMSINKFAKAFKAKTGTSPYKFVLSRRLSLACNLLQKTNDPLADIAYEAGFSSQSLMTEFFRRNLSTTPGKYRARACSGV